MPGAYTLAVACIAALGSACAFAQAVVTFRAVSELRQDGSPALIGGREAASADYPASFFVEFEDRPPCGASLVGPKVLLTAAHCVSQGGSVHLKVSDVLLRGECTQAPGFDTDESVDVALCLLEAPVTVPLYETINRDPTLLREETLLRLTGFGCTTPSMTGSDGRFREGDSEIVNLPTAPTYHIVVRPRGQWEAVLCPGDSGGGAYLLRNGAANRLLVAVNSRTRVDPDSGLVQQTSSVTSLASPAVESFVQYWAIRSGEQVCGYGSTYGCR